jgi:hypothetical protein
MKINIPDNIWSVSITTVPCGDREADKVRMHYHVEAIDHRDAVDKSLQHFGKTSRYDRVTITVQPFPAIPGLREFEICPYRAGDEQ